MVKYIVSILLNSFIITQYYYYYYILHYDYYYILNTSIMSLIHYKLQLQIY